MEVQLGCKGTRFDLHGIKLQAHEDRNGTELFGAVAVLALTCGTEMGPNWDRNGTELWTEMHKLKNDPFPLMQHSL